MITYNINVQADGFFEGYSLERILLTEFFRQIEKSLGSQQEQPYLHTLYLSQHADKSDKVLYSVKINSVEYQFNLDHNILMRKRFNKKNLTGVRYEVYGEKVGQGGLSNVYKSLMTMMLPEKGLITTTSKYNEESEKTYNKVRVIKESNTQSSGLLFFPGMQVKGLGIKPNPPLHIGGLPPSNNGIQKSAEVMRYIPGEELFYYLHRNKNLTPSMRVTIALKILEAVYDQVHSLSLVHQDLKTENLMIYSNNNEIKIQVIDVTTCKSKHDQTSSANLTYEYAAPEALLKKGTTQQSDVYSLGCVLMKVLFDHSCEEFQQRDKVRSFLCGQNDLLDEVTNLIQNYRITNYIGPLQSITENNQTAYPDLMNIIQEYGSENALELKYILSRMLDFSPSKRSKVPEIIDVLKLVEDNLIKKENDNNSLNTRGKKRKEENDNPAAGFKRRTSI